MRVITLEEHVSTSAIQQATGCTPESAPDGYWRKVLARLLDMGATRLSEMDAAGIDVQVLSLAPFESEISDAAASTSLVRDANDAISEAVRTHPGRFAGFANLALQDPAKAALEFERCVNKLGFKGALVSGTIDGKFLDDEKFTPLFEAAQSLDIPIYLHPAPPPEAVREVYFSGLPGQSGLALSTAGWGWHSETALHVLRLILSGVFERFPTLKIIIGHMGENLPFALDRIESVFERQTSHLKRSVAAYFHDHVWITVSGYFTMAPFLCALSVVGADRILFSVDYPFSETKVARAFLNAIPVSPEDRVKIAGGNAERLLKF